MPSKTPEILIYNYSKTRFIKKFIISIISRIFVYLPKNKINTLSVIAVTPSKIKNINAFWRKQNKKTTILTFLEGDIFLCPQEIKKRAQQLKISEYSLYQQLLLHGILHLLGYTHNQDKDRIQMEKMERKILSKMNKK